jgi:hypothetical protein
MYVYIYIHIYIRMYYIQTYVYTYIHTYCLKKLRCEYIKKFMVVTRGDGTIGLALL